MAISAAASCDRRLWLNSAGIQMKKAASNEAAFSVTFCYLHAAVIKTFAGLPVPAGLTAATLKL
jgi:hypothetical protein